MVVNKKREKRSSLTFPGNIIYRLQILDLIV